jgi:hypothetical protein
MDLTTLTLVLVLVVALQGWLLVDVYRHIDKLRGSCRTMRGVMMSMLMRERAIMSAMERILDARIVIVTDQDPAQDECQSTD